MKIVSKIISILHPNNKSISKLSNIFTHLTNQEKDTLYNLGLSLKKKSVIVEIGSYLGASSCFLASAAKKRKSILHCIDTWENHEMSEGYRNTFEEFMTNTESLAKFIEIHKGFSSDIAKTIDFKIDMIFFDGGHSYETIKLDWESWSPKLKESAVVIFHDFGWAEGVKKVIEENSSSLVPKGALPNMWWGIKN